jgi:hypothetical protein
MGCRGGNTYLRVEFPKHKDAWEGVPERKEDGGILSGSKCGEERRGAMVEDHDERRGSIGTLLVYTALSLVYSYRHLLHYCGRYGWVWSLRIGGNKGIRQRTSRQTI